MDVEFPDQDPNHLSGLHAKPVLGIGEGHLWALLLDSSVGWAEINFTLAG